ncbi:hypothetical protein MCOR25_009451 [Pyricularia grisea]|uniref:gamma-glutamylcyclotransferase n=1 Tax=Pyricularia grisea TaxID=148305 RepID=A0A6P8ATN7_PYRGI|nr:uncharacterized protein PgNI_09905 [Pyricularia grisea]KAI6352382.1 hypothetical protein MCOR25_009451 [Pyricularia grisea]TLD05496.1 hypothetical protein PgNI_09905 [Pyricularia grisea]
MSSPISSSGFSTPSSFAGGLPMARRTMQRSAYYFAYGSNLSPTQMEQRCPGSIAKGLALLPDWSFIVNERGFANVMPTGALAHEVDMMRRKGTLSPVAESLDIGAEEGVWGVLYHLCPEDEKMLDITEGAGFACIKYYADVEVLLPARPRSAASSSTSSSQNESEAEARSYMVPALIYVDRHRVKPSMPREDYVARMNRGIEEAQARYGLPEGYVQRAIRPFIPSR